MFLQYTAQKSHKLYKLKLLHHLIAFMQIQLNPRALFLQTFFARQPSKHRVQK